MLSKLWFRFLIIFSILTFCGGVLAIVPLKKGIDLAGGVDLLYELDLSSLKNSNVNVKEVAGRLIAVLQKRIDPNGLKNLTWRVVGDDRIEIQMPLATPETIEARKEFSDAFNALIASNIPRTQLDLAISQTNPAVRKAALDKIAAPGSDQRKLIDDLATAYEARQAVEAKAQAVRVATGTIPGDLVRQLTDARAAYDTKHDALTSDTANVNATDLKDILDDMEDMTNATARKRFEDFRDRPEFASRRPLFDALYAANLNLVAHSSGGFDDPEALKHELRGRGVLEFRIAVDPGDAAVKDAEAKAIEVGPRKAKLTGMQWYEIDPKNGGELTKGMGGCVIRHFPPFTAKELADPKLKDNTNNYFILLYINDTDHVLDHSDRFSPWALTSAGVSNRGSDPVVTFEFDNQGGAYFGDLTSRNVNKPMAIILDDKAISAPNINTPIRGGRGEITLGRGTRSITQVNEEAKQLTAMLEAGSLPAALKPDPTGQQDISSTLGADNIQKGLYSSVYAVIAVALFMIMYYSLTGLFANLAVVVNLVMLLAAMALLKAPLTLPGIAGIVLTLGMAVDSNVLINERIREEVHRGASLWMAVRQGYDKVFWTIFDAHITTSLTSVVLIFIDQIGTITGMGSGGGANEVKGFGVTLLIGLMCSMFTALFVTRTLMVASVKWGILRQIDSTDPIHWINDIITLQFLKGKWPFLKMLTVANIDWMGKKYYFWVFSAIITVLGMTAFFYRGSDKYDTEFNGGTQVTMKLAVQPGNPHTKLPDIGGVRDMVTKDMPKLMAQKAVQLQSQAAAMTDAKAKADALARASSLSAMVKEAEAANVLEVGTAHTDFQVVATVSGVAGNDFVATLAETFHDYMPLKPALRFKDADLADPTKKDINSTAPTFDTVRPVNDALLSNVVPLLPDEAPPELAMNDTSSYVKGLAIVLDDISPPQPMAALQQRIQDAREGLSGAHFRQFEIVPVAFADNPPATAPAGQTNWAARPVKKAVILILDPNIANTEDDWIKSVVLPEWRTIQDALKNPSPISGSVASFDAAVADAAKAQAVIAMAISLSLVVIYVWIRFGSIKYGIGAILSLAHDALMAVSATVLAGLVYLHFRPLADALLLSDFKINLTMIAAYLTIVGYSVNDTIVIFDRIRENRGRGMAPLTRKLVNDSINQCFGRTIWTTFTVFIVVLILYIWGGEGVRGFSFAMFIGVLTGAYSTLAIASPALLSIREEPALPPAPSTELATVAKP